MPANVLLSLMDLRHSLSIPTTVTWHIFPHLTSPFWCESPTDSSQLCFCLLHCTSVHLDALEDNQLHHTYLVKGHNIYGLELTD